MYIEISKITQGMTGQQVADLIFENEQGLNAGKLETDGSNAKELTYAETTQLSRAWSVAMWHDSITIEDEASPELDAIAGQVGIFGIEDLTHPFGTSEARYLLINGSLTSLGDHDLQICIAPTGDMRMRIADTDSAMNTPWVYFSFLSAAQKKKYEQKSQITTSDLSLIDDPTGGATVQEFYAPITDFQLADNPFIFGLADDGGGIQSDTFKLSTISNGWEFAEQLTFAQQAWGEDYETKKPFFIFRHGAWNTATATTDWEGWSRFDQAATDNAALAKRLRPSRASYGVVSGTYLNVVNVFRVIPLTGAKYARPNGGSEWHNAAGGDMFTVNAEDNYTVSCAFNASTTSTSRRFLLEITVYDHLGAPKAATECAQAYVQSAAASGGSLQSFVVPPTELHLLAGDMLGLRLKALDSSGSALTIVSDGNPALTVVKANDYGTGVYS